MFNVHIYIIAVNFISHGSYKVYMMPHDAVQVGSSLDFGSASRYFVTFLSERVGLWIFFFFYLHFAFSDTWTQIFLKSILTCYNPRCRGICFILIFSFYYLLFFLILVSYLSFLTHFFLYLVCFL